VLVVPNPSGRNAHYSYAAMLEAFRLLSRVESRGQKRPGRALT